MTTRTRWLLLILLVGLLAAYANSLKIGFELDDAYYIAANPWIRSLWSIPRLFVDPATNNRPDGINEDIRPVVYTTYALNYAVSGLNPWSYHLLGLLIHLGATGLVFLIVRDFIAPAWGAEGAALVAFLFALAPLNGEPIIYQSARSASLMTLGYLAAFYLILKGRTGWGLICQGLALGAKVVAITLPASLILYIFCYGKWKDQRLRLAVAASALVDGCYLIYRGWLVPIVPSSVGVDALTWSLSQPWAYLTYMRRFVWPSDLSIDHENLWVMGLTDWRFSVAMVLLGAGLIAAFRWRRQYPELAFGAGWFLLTLSVESSVIPMSEMTNDHRPYIGTALGLAVLVTAGLRRLVMPKAMLAACIGIALAFGAVTIDRNWQWQDSVRLWEYTARTNPGNGRAWMNAGVGLMGRGQYAEARRYFEEARRRYPGYAYVYANLSILDGVEGHLESSLRNAETAVRLNPRWPAARTYVAAAARRLQERVAR